jgi:hypothetical protein
MNPPIKFRLGRLHARTVYDAWKIARDEANAYQRMMNKLAKKKHSQKFITCRAARDAASRIALKIRYGGRRRSS